MATLSFIYILRKHQKRKKSAFDNADRNDKLIDQNQNNFWVPPIIILNQQKKKLRDQFFVDQ